MPSGGRCDTPIIAIIARRHNRHFLQARSPPQVLDPVDCCGCAFLTHMNLVNLWYFWNLIEIFLIDAQKNCKIYNVPRYHNIYQGYYSANRELAKTPPPVSAP